MRKPEIISKSHTENLTAETLNKFFRIVYCIYNDKSIFEDANAAKRKYNANESGFSTNPNQKKMFFKKSSRNAYMMTPTCGKAMYTVSATGDAAGEYMQPLVVYKAQYLNDTWTINGPKDATHAVTEMVGCQMSFLNSGFEIHSYRMFHLQQS